MKIAISQPEHIPYLGYFQKMVYSDLFVILDDVEFQGRGSFQNRNRFKTQNGSMEWFTVPVEKNSYYRKINEVRVAPDYGWKRKLIRKMEMNFNSNTCNYGAIYNNYKLIDINMIFLEMCRHELKIDTPIMLSSHLKISGQKNELLYNICKHLGATTYISGQGSKAYLNEDSFEDIAIEFITPHIDDYDSTISYLYGKNKRLERAKELINIFREAKELNANNTN
ncbi:WbqC family protein [Paenibacillus macerans]|uniref:WbqC-like family protein n=1 Tax=Paenibacillus macerans TaxID=44252 RepID=A0A091A4F6_PAEMA|nr:WbqC family protein [Paenibacillus macerans]KFN11156.1 wbqC-like family protein [Paenibacillus macerans]MCY7560216.1 WbqC family protein [Paenibacillus macerans]MEC0151270.1 WbqC family protein [Paenibacillus macerans]SUD26827.1 WbqC-like protein family [Paenibacillus macerans]